MRRHTLNTSATVGAAPNHPVRVPMTVILYNQVSASLCRLVIQVSRHNILQARPTSFQWAERLCTSLAGTLAVRLAGAAAAGGAVLIESPTLLHLASVNICK